MEFVLFAGKTNIAYTNKCKFSAVKIRNLAQWNIAYNRIICKFVCVCVCVCVTSKALRENEIN